MSIKKENHYVPAFYLKGWCNGLSKKGSVFWLYKGKVENRNISSIARKKYFYSFEPFGQAEYEFLFYSRDAYILNNSAKTFAGDWVDFCKLLARFDSLNASQLEQANDLSITLTGEKLQENKKTAYANSIENWYQKIELEAAPIMLDLRKGYLKTLRSNSKMEFLYKYVWSQFMRTKKAKDMYLPILKDNYAKIVLKAKEIGHNPDNNINMEAVYKVMIPVVTHSLISHNKNRNIYLLQNLNYGVQPLLTSDSPVVIYKSQNTIGKGFEGLTGKIYFPISPQYAILIEEKGVVNRVYKYNKINTMSGREIFEFNKAIAETRHEQLFSSTEESLKSFK
ncbi:MAG: DUF4238 domain-containing protein [Firmicutes bacterium]|nr:DUF4238 domain-containing protein [Bacillota bacterium]